MSQVDDLARLACLDVPDLGLHDAPVLRLEGRERISELSWFEIAVVVPDTLQLGELLGALPGARATLKLRSGQRDGRVFHGDVVAASTAPQTNLGAVLRVRLESSLSRLERRSSSRLFQQCSVRQTIEGLLREHEIPGIWRLTRGYPPREQCLQYRESDFSVMDRLLAEEGIFFWVDHEPKGATVVFADDARFYGAVTAELHVREHGSASRLLAGVHDSVFDFSVRQRVAPTSTVSRRYDVRRPHLALDAEAKGSGRDVTALPLRATNVNDALAPVPVDAIYRHGTSFRSSQRDDEQARILLEQHRRDARLATGRTDACALLPGHLVVIRDHHVGELDAAYVVVQVDHDLDAMREQPYQAEFRAVPRQVPYRSLAVEPRRIDALELATVIGPEPGSVHIDELGRIKVRFHWERLRHDEPEGAWVRVTQAWAGAGWGAQFIPRVGTEVVVSFLGGDPDQPVVLGTLYHGGAPHPMVLPDEKHWSGFRSTTLGLTAEGSNEILFSDLPGAEQMVMRAQADFRQHLGSKSSVLVESDAEVRIGGSRASSVGGTDTTSVDGDILVSNRGAYARLVGGDVTSLCEGNLSETVSRGVQRESLELLETTRNARIVRAGEKLSILVGDGAAEEGVEGHYDLATTGSQRRYAGTVATMTAEEAISFVCGDSSITLTPKTIILEAPEIRVNGEERSVVSGGGAALHLSGGASLGGGEVVIASGGASLVLDADAHLDGSLVKLNCGGADAAGAESADSSEEMRTLRMKFADSTGTPYALAAYDLLAAGCRRRGKTTADGLVEAAVPASATSVAVTLRSADSPDEPITWSIDVAPALLPIDTTAGVKARLHNLGYPITCVDDVEEDEYREALAQFQADQGLEPDGKMGPETRAALATQHP